MSEEEKKIIETEVKENSSEAKIENEKEGKFGTTTVTVTSTVIVNGKVVSSNKIQKIKKTFGAEDDEINNLMKDFGEDFGDIDNLMNADIGNFEIEEVGGDEGNEEPEIDFDSLKEGIDELSLEELEERIQEIKDLKSETTDSKNLMKLKMIKKACKARKNEILAEEEKKRREEMIKKRKIEQEKLRKQEEERRKALEKKKKEELKKKLEEEAKAKEEAKRKKEAMKKNIHESLTKEVEGSNQPIPEHSYRNQKLETKSNYEDPLFPPELNSLCKTKDGMIIFPKGKKADSSVGYWVNYKWADPSKIFKGKEFDVFSGAEGENEIDASDIRQGELGDCYFLSAIAALANRNPEYIRKLFHFKKLTENGCYAVYFNIGGEWKMVVVDDKIPCKFTYGNYYPAFSQSNGNELWVLLLEKAWAKINGNYVRAIGGLSYQVFQCITEAYAESINFESLNKEPETKLPNDAFFERMVRSQKMGFIMAAGTQGGVSKERTGLVAGHAYSVLHFYDLPAKGKHGKIKLVQLRNPWASQEWSGKYTDGSPELEAIKDELMAYNKDLKFENKDDGVFFMPYEDFCKYYDNISVCHLRDNNWQYKTIKISSKKERSESTNDDSSKGRLIDTKSGVLSPAITKLVVEQDTDAYLSLCQKNSRVRLRTKPYHKDYVLGYLMLLDKDFNYITSESESSAAICIRTQLKKGEYYLLSDINYRYVVPKGQERGYVISAYTEKEVNFKTIDGYQDQIPEIIRKTHRQFIMKLANGELTDGYLDKTMTDEEAKKTFKKMEPERKKLGKGVLVTYKNRHLNRLPNEVYLFKNEGEKPITMTMQVYNQRDDAHGICIYYDEKFKENELKFEIELKGQEERMVIVHHFTSDYATGAQFSYSYYP